MPGASCLTSGFTSTWTTATSREWIRTLEEVQRRFPQFPSYEAEAWVTGVAYNVLLMRQPWNPALQVWEERALSLALAGHRRDIGQALLIQHGWWAMDLARGRLLAEAFRSELAPDELHPAFAT